MSDTKQHTGRPSGRPAVSPDPTLLWIEPTNATIILGRKVCPGCTWRHIMDFPIQTNGRLKGRCRRCLAEGERAKRGKTGKPRKVYATEQQRIEGRRRAARAARRRRRQDPEYLRREREARRIYQEGVRRKSGIKPRGVTYKLKDGDSYSPSSRDFVDSKPFVEWLNSLPTSYETRWIAREIGIDDARIAIWRSDNPPPKVSLGFVDRALHAISPDTNLIDIYPLDA